MMPNSYWLPDRATSEDYLDVARSMIQYHTEKRDIYCPGGEIWVTESGDAGGGGTTWLPPIWMFSVPSTSWGHSAP